MIFFKDFYVFSMYVYVMMCMCMHHNTYVEVKVTCKSWFSPCTIWDLWTELGCQVWWRTPLPVEPSLGPSVIFSFYFMVCFWVPVPWPCHDFSLMIQSNIHGVIQSPFFIQCPLIAEKTISSWIIQSQTKHGGTCLWLLHLRGTGRRIITSGRPCWSM